MAGPGPGVGCDVMVSYDQSDKVAVDKIIEEEQVVKSILHPMMQWKSTDYFSDHFKKAGLKVWIPSKPNDDNGQAVVNCKIFVQVLSETAADSKSCQDELSLAYVSNTPIFPVGLDEFTNVARHLDAGRKLMLAKINWTFLRHDEDYQNNLPQLVTCIKEKLAETDENEAGDGGADKTDEDLDELFFTMNSTTQTIMNNIRRSSQVTQEFWDTHFKGSEIAWSDFQREFLDEYRDLMVEEFGEDKEIWLISLVHRDIFSNVTKLQRDVYSRFCGPNLNNDPDLFFNRVKDYAVSISAMKEVFDMDSTVRLTAVQQLGAYRTQAVLVTLLDLLHDDDPNMRVVAALALGRSGRATKRVVDELLKSLTDDDRLVRESVCLSLGHLKAKRAVQPILDVWRNDPIRNVRDAANIALGKIGGEEVDDAMKVTKVLSEEMANLRTKKR